MKTLINRLGRKGRWEFTLAITYGISLGFIFYPDTYDTKYYLFLGPFIFTLEIDKKEKVRHQ
tara:strand:- start:772 stop:957 length:186 start_codon:yes stop_codon:yes gene_type:complete